MVFQNLKTTNKGFTLIELLVVIAIIGTLSSVVLSNLNTARGKGANATVKANMDSLRKEIEVYYNNFGSYGTVGTTLSTNCPTAASNAGFMFNDPASTKVRTIILAAQAAANSTNTLKCIATPTSGGATNYIVSSPLNVTEGGNNWWCIDSNGVSRGHANPITVATTACP
jgi:type IV pilus assembly protein PilA